MSQFIQTIKQLITRIMGQTTRPEQQKEQLVKGLMTALSNTREDEISCDEVYEVVDQYAEAVIEGKDVQTLMPLVYHHIHMCAVCREELELLLELIQLTTA